MCLAIFKPPGVTIPEEHLRGGWISNPDGAGFAFVEKGKVKFVKGLMTLQEFLKVYNSYAALHPESPFLVHFRIRSQGDKSEANTHPFPFKHGCGIHNGTIDGTGAKWNEGKSDTALFFEKHGDRLSYKIVEENRTDLERAIGVGNKIALLYNNGKHIILNPHLGTWKDTVWYSNHSFVPRRDHTHDAQLSMYDD